MADKNFKVKTGLSLPSPLPLEQGGTGQTSANNALNALLPLQTSANGQYLKSDGTDVSWSTVISGFTAMPSTSVSSNITLAAFNKYFVDTTAARTLTLPASPSVGDEIYVFDASGSAATYNITIERNSNKINSLTENAIIDVNSSSSSFVYSGSTVGWRFD